MNATLDRLEGYTESFMRWQQAWNKRCHYPPTPEEIAHHKEALSVIQEIDAQANEVLF